jgi:hypothetical protein
MNWFYRIKAPDEKVRDPIQGEFFATEAIKNPADALVREAIQNALDCHTERWGWRACGSRIGAQRRRYIHMELKSIPHPVILSNVVKPCLTFFPRRSGRV